MREQNLPESDSPLIDRHVAGYPSLKYSLQSTLIFWQLNHIRAILAEYDMLENTIIEALIAKKFTNCDHQLDHFQLLFEQAILTKAGLTVD